MTTQVSDLSDVPFFRKRSDIAKLVSPGAIGIELGVAEGLFSHALLKEGSFGHFYSVDMWAGDRGHDIDQYRRALKVLEEFRDRNTCLKMRFDEAIEMFEDSFFDFIYIDGYAHTGQENGETLEMWWPKLKPGGLFAGDDYSEKYPKVIAVADDFASRHSLKLSILKPAAVENTWSRSPSWIARKPKIDVASLRKTVLNANSLEEMRQPLLDIIDLISAKR